ncbi:MAG: aldehyde dehydrogenase family protein [Gemmatimonadota bacterium]
MTSHHTPPSFQNFIAGAWRPALSGETFPNRNPARWDEILGHFPRSSTDDVDAAVAAARDGFRIWGATPAPARGDVLRRCGDILAARKDEIASVATREMGKVLEETRGDVQEGIDTAYYAGSETRRLFGHTVPSELPRKWAMSYRRPVGVAGVITPFNFPLAIPTWKIFPALACGNAVVFKPGEDVPHTAHLFIEALLEAGLPPEVVQLIHGFGQEAGEPLVSHSGVDLVSFTGSTETGRRIGEICGRDHRRLSLEMGGKNAQIVLPDADMELALDGVLWGAFGTTGQRCTATSRLLLHQDIAQDFLEELLPRARALHLGDGLLPETQVGPLINPAALEKVEGYMKVAQVEGDVVLGGSRAEAGELSRGHFFHPTVVTGLLPGSTMATEEVFGPVLSVLTFSTVDEAIAINNEVQYGLSSSIYTRDVTVAFRAFQELDNGITYVNAPTIGAEAHLPFGGVKQTGNGHREGGWEVYEFYSETKVCYVDYSGSLQRAQIDNY